MTDLDRKVAVIAVLTGKTEDGKWLVLTRDYFWQKWHPYMDADGNPVSRYNIEDALRAVGSAWWDKFYVRVDSKGVF
jgi:hypothetical protein